MDLDEYRSFISDSGVDVWTWINMSISVASADHEDELKNRRDGIIQKLYTPAFSKCHNCDRKEKSERNEDYDQQKQDVGFDCNPEEMGSGKKVATNEDDDEQRKILDIKILLDDQNQSERSLIGLLQKLVDMDTTFKALKETDIGRHVTKLRKHSSNEVRRLVKILVRKWKETVDEWVRLNTPVEEEDEEVEEATQFNGDRNVSCYSTPEKRKVKHNENKSDELVPSGKHIHAKKQRTPQEMDFHDIPRHKNPILSNHGGGVPVKNWRRRECIDYEG